MQITAERHRSIDDVKVGICGFGVVGKSLKQLFPDAYVYDTGLGMGTREELNTMDVVFIAVPTPGTAEGQLDTSIVEEVVSWCECPLLIIRSTLNPGTADYLEFKYSKKIVVVPEYIGETIAHPLMDERARSFLIIGGYPENRKKAIEVFRTVYNSNVHIRQVSNRTAEIIKLSENRAIAWRVMAAHELYEACEAAGEDYETIRQAVYGDDPRFNLFFSWADPDNLGFHSSKCLSKDIPAWCAWAESVGHDPILTRKLVEQSEEYAREKVAGA